MSMVLPVKSTENSLVSRPDN